MMFFFIYIFFHIRCNISKISGPFRERYLTELYGTKRLETLQPEHCGLLLNYDILRFYVCLDIYNTKLRPINNKNSTSYIRLYSVAMSN